MADCLVPGCGLEHTRTEAERLNLRLCARCKKVAYCSKACQTAAWKNGHKAVCQVPCHSLNEIMPPVLVRLNMLYSDKKFADVAAISDDVLAFLEKDRNLLPCCVVGAVCNMVGFSLVEVSKYKKALEVLLKGKSMILQTRDIKLLEDVCDSLGSCYGNLGRYEDAMVEFEQALALNVDIGDKAGQASCQDNIASTLMDLKRFTEARVALDRCWTLRVELDDRAGKAAACANLGMFFVNQGRVLDGIDCLRKGHSEFKQMGIDGDMARAGVILGKTFMDSRDIFSVPVATLQQRVQEYLALAYTTSVRCSLIPALMGSFMQLARLSIWRGDEDEAVKQLEHYLDACVLDVGKNFCSGCMQRRAAETPMLVCAECRVVRYKVFLFV